MTQPQTCEKSGPSGACLSWCAPTCRVDGTELDPATLEYAIYRVRSDGGGLLVAETSETSALLLGEPLGLRCWYVTARERGGGESAPSIVVCKLITTDPDSPSPPIDGGIQGDPEMSDPILRFRPSPSTDVVGYRVRVRAANTAPAYDAPYYDVVPAPPTGPDGYVRIALLQLPGVRDLDGRYDVHVTALDDAPGQPNESEFLEVDDHVFDLVPPAPPTDGTIEN